MSKRSFTKVVTIALLSVSALALQSCGEEKVPTIPAPPEKPIVIEYSNPGAEPRCGCETSRGVFLRNVSNRDRAVSYWINARDTESGLEVSPQQGQQIIQPGSSNRFFAGCTIYAPETSCRFDATFRLGTVSTLREVPPSMKALFGAQVSPSISSCIAWCDPKFSSSDPNSGDCLELGPRFDAAIRPLLSVMSGANPGDVITSAKVLAAYNLTSAENKCERGDTVVTGDLIRNEGAKESCEISSVDLPEAVLRSIGMTTKDLDPLQLTARVPKVLEATRFGATQIMGRSSSDIFLFPYSSTAPSIRFGGVDGDSFTELYGGDLLASASVITPGIGAQTIIATTNGCIAVDR